MIVPDILYHTKPNLDPRLTRPLWRPHNHIQYLVCVRTVKYIAYILIIYVYRRCTLDIHPRTRDNVARAHGYFVHKLPEQ